AALASGALVAAGGIEQKRDSTGGCVADPFSYTQVMERWYGAVRELADGTDLDEAQSRMVMHGADLPRYAYDDEADALQEAAREGWTTYKTKRALSATLLPKESSGMWDSRSKYRTAVSRIARTLATENWNLQVAGILDT